MPKASKGPFQYRTHILIYAPALLAMNADERASFVRDDLYSLLKSESLLQQERVTRFLDVQMGNESLAAKLSYEKTKISERAVLDEAFANAQLLTAPNDLVDFTFVLSNVDPEFRKIHHTRRRQHLLLGMNYGIFRTISDSLMEKLMNKMALSDEDLFPGTTPLDDFYRGFRQTYESQSDDSKKLIAIDLIG
jgi:hypothetical protein